MTQLEHELVRAYSQDPELVFRLKAKHPILAKMLSDIVHKELTPEMVHPYPGQELRKSSFKQGSGTYEGEYKEDVYSVNQLDEANIVTSKMIKQKEGEFTRHKPLLDIDVPCKLVASTTPGHYHLYINYELDWPQYVHLLYVLADVGIIEEGYMQASVKRGYSAVRLPWIKKE